MNILIDQSLHNFLYSKIIDTIYFGSVMKNNNSNNSDNDFFHIIREPWFFRNTTLFIGHQLQYKEYNNDILLADHIYVTTRQFLYNIINAESGIPYEVLIHGRLKNTSLYWLESHKDEFKNFQTAKCFLGLARRDLQDACKLFSGEKSKAIKKLRFVGESLHYVNDILIQHNLDIPRNYNCTISEYDTYDTFKQLVESLEAVVGGYRLVLQKHLEQGKITKNISATLFQTIATRISLSATIDNKTPFDNQLNTLYYNAMIHNNFK